MERLGSIASQKDISGSSSCGGRLSAFAPAMASFLARRPMARERLVVGVLMILQVKIERNEDLVRPLPHEAGVSCHDNSFDM